MFDTGHQAAPGYSNFYQPNQRPQAEWEAIVKQLLDEGQAFLAYDLSKKGLEQYPESLKLKQSMAWALIRTGALEEATRILEKIYSDLHLEETKLVTVYNRLNSLHDFVVADKLDPSSKQILAAMTDLLDMFNTMFKTIQPNQLPDEETLGLIARLYKDRWKRLKQPEDANRCQAAYLHSFRTTGGYWSGINAATMSWLIGKKELAQELARQVLQLCESIPLNIASPQEQYWLSATIGEAYLLLEQEAQAINAYERAVNLSGRNYAYISSSLQQLRLLKEQGGFNIPAKLFTVLKPPTLVLFGGHMIDRPGHPVPRFPAWLEGAVRDEIEQQLADLNAQIGYSSAACGADILFIETMLDREAEVNIVLPFHPDDFITTSVQQGGPQWIVRFRRALKLAHSIKYITEEPMLGDEILYAFVNKLFQSYAELRAGILETKPYLLVVWDGKANNNIGGTADLVAHWADKNRLRIIDTTKLLATTQTNKSYLARTTSNASQPEIAQATRPKLPAIPPSYSRVIRTMLFADLVGYSKLQERYTPFFMNSFLEQVAERLQKFQPNFINTWGDAIFVVMTQATPLAEYALALQEAIRDTNWNLLGLQKPVNVRIALHAGPVFVGKDPFTGRENFYGSQVNRAARIEPVTVPGYIYASEQFIAMLNSEQASLELAANQPGQAYENPFVYEYLGTLSLAKNFGSQTAYQLRRKSNPKPN